MNNKRINTFFSYNLFGLKLTQRGRVADVDKVERFHQESAEIENRAINNAITYLLNTY